MHPAVYILGTRIDVLTLGEAASDIVEWARLGESKYVCVANVYNVMLARAEPRFQSITNHASLVTCDGMPIRWIQRSRGFRQAERVYGPDLMLLVAERCSSDGIPVALYGGTESAISALEAHLVQRFPAIRIAFRLSPPFQSFDHSPQPQTATELANSGARVVFVGLGTPKQDHWMAANSPGFPGVMIGVGAAFDFLSGAKRQAPRWMMDTGLEWLFRLLTEPRRLWRRYFYSVPPFILLLLLEVCGIEKILRRFRRPANHSLPGAS
jgi:N-acetylglucosaminyldiphosphoundecaprenol N-acetyl-beta-D-mannosaminyltransferase